MNSIKKFLASALLMIPLAASAATWTVITEADDGDRLLLNVDSFFVTPDKNQMLVAEFKLTMSENVFVMSTPKSSCKRAEGDMYQLGKNERGEWAVTQKLFWTEDGNKLYDFAGVALCAIDQMQLKSSKQRKTL